MSASSSPLGGALQKTCGCGRIHSVEAWADLPFCGVMRGVDEIPDLELRHCPCGTTLAVPVGWRDRHAPP